MIEDVALLRRYAAEKSEEAFAELVRRRVGLVYSVALRQVGGDAHLAEDVTQRVFADLARKAAALSSRAVLSGWLYRSAQFAASDVVRAERRRRAREEESQTMNETLAADAAIDWEKVRPVLDETLGELADEDRDAVALRFFEDRPFAEIGATLNVSEDTARKRVDRALDKLHALLARRGVTSTTAALSLALANQVSVAAPAGLAAAVTSAVLTGATTGGVGAGILAFMSTSKSIAAVASVAAVVALGVAWFQLNTARRTAAALATVTAERDALNKQLKASQEAPLAPAAASSTAAVAVPAMPAATSKSLGRELDHVLANPEARAAYLKRATLSMKVHFERFFVAAGLTGEEQDRFLKLAMDDAEGRLDALEMRRDAGAFDPGGSTMDREAIARVTAFQKKRDEDVTNGLRALLGDKFPLLRESMNTVYERNVADKLASRLYYTEAPLTAQQSEDLVKVLVQDRLVHKTDTMGGAPLPGEVASRRLYLPLSQTMPWTLDNLISDAALAQAGAILSPKQVAALKVIQAEHLAELQVLPPVPAERGRTPSK